MNFFFFKVLKLLSLHIIKIEDLKLKDLYLSLEESRYTIEFLVRKRGVNNYKHKSNDELFKSIYSNINY